MKSDFSESERGNFVEMHPHKTLSASSREEDFLYMFRNTCAGVVQVSDFSEYNHYFSFSRQLCKHDTVLMFHKQVHRGSEMVIG